MSRNVLVVASHPDDEILGVGATIAKHANNGDKVHILIIAEGATSRSAANAADDTRALRHAAAAAAKELGAQPPVMLDLADNRLDSLALIDIVQPIEAALIKAEPQIVYTHFVGDLNRDHTATAEAVEIACRPLPGQTVEALYAFETVSSTEWSLGMHGAFAPQMFVDISATLSTKLRALECYKVEMREFPHARSIEGIMALAKLRGSQAGLPAAEAFMIRRDICR